MKNIFKRRRERITLFNVRSKRENNYSAKEIPDDLFRICKRCKSTVQTEVFKSNLYVCPECGSHVRIGSRERIRQIVDEGTFKETDADVTTTDVDFEGYSEKLDKYKNDTGLNEAVICGIGKINGEETAIAVMDSYFMMGSMGSVVGDKITRLIERADENALPLVIFCASGGARMQEGIVSLIQMAKTSAALKRFGDHGNLYISVLTNPTTGGVSASFAMLGDIIIAEPRALIGFAGRRVIEKTINEELPKEFQRAEFVKEKGFVDMIVERKKMKKTLSDLIRLHGVK